jgi:predicted helicase
MTDENVHILDPFTGTGTFITRLLQSGIIKPKDLERKYTKEIHANEIILLAYYIASINIENIYHDLLKIAEPYNPRFYENEELYAADSAKVIDFPGKNKIRKGVGYTAFPGICLTDTFQLGETGENLFSEIFPQNSERVLEQQKTPLRVIIGNPPYSVGQKSANDNAQNQSYPKLEARIAETYAASSNATNKNSLYDSYIKAFRWSADRLDPENGGVVSFVSNGAWLDGNAQAGFRTYMEKEFSSVYVFNLRGNQRTSGELSRREGGKIFGSGSRTPISITLLVKNPKWKVEKATIHYYDIGDYLGREKKLEIIRDFVTASNLPWKTLSPNVHGDWISQRNDSFSTFIPIGNKDDKSISTFFTSNYSNGLKTARDQFCWNFSVKRLKTMTNTIIGFYNLYCKKYQELIKTKRISKIEDFLAFDSTKITWNRSFKQDLIKGKLFKYNSSCIYIGSYRPFNKEYLYFSRDLNDMTYQMPKLFPTKDTNNLIICVSCVGTTGGLSVLVSNKIADVHFNGDPQCFPLYWYEKKEKTQSGLFEQVDNEYIRHDAISDFILEQAQSHYGHRVEKEDIFYYVYGILHSPEYRKTFANDLKKMLPRLPLVEKPADFWAFSKAGREVADLHLNYEEQQPLKEVEIIGEEKGIFDIEKMRFGIAPGKRFGERIWNFADKTTILYNAHITISNIPAKAYEYIVNGKSAIEWIMERYAVTTHKESGIKNDPNDWAKEHGNPRYTLDLLLSVIMISIRTIEIVEKLPTILFDKFRGVEKDKI